MTMFVYQVLNVNHFDQIMKQNFNNIHSIQDIKETCLLT